jgi:hypothetical protein
MNIVKSVEAVGFTFNSATYSQDLTKGQAAENCVPFKSTYASSGLSGYSFGVFTDATVTGTTPTFYAERSNHSTCYPQFYIVEFEPTEVNVQSGSFSFSGATHTTTVSGIDTSKSMLVIHYKSNYGDRYLSDMAVRAKFGATVSGITDIELQRGKTSGIISGHWYVAEDLNDNFDVEHFEASSNSYSTSPELINRYNLNSTMFLASYYNTVLYDANPQHNCVRFHVRDEIRANLDRNGNANEFYAAYQVIRFNIGEDKRMVFRRSASMAGGTSSYDWDLDDGYSQLYSVDLDYSMVYNPMQVQTGYSYTGNSAEYERQYFGASFLDANTVRIQRGDSGDTNIYSVEIVDWSASITVSGVSPATKDPNLVAVNSMVRSIESVNFTASHYWQEVQLTKGQILDNCVPFLTQDCSSAAGSYMFNDAYFLEPSTLRVANPDGATRTFKGSIVEFEPDQVRVQSGTFYTSDTTVTATISGVDLDKAALKFYYQATDGNYPRYDHYVRGRFTSASGLEFYRYGTAGAIKGTYYVFEALDDQFSVTYGTGTTGGNTITAWDDNYEAYNHRSFCTGSYYYDNSDQNPQHKNVYGNHDNRGYIGYSRLGNGGTIGIAWFIIKLKGMPNRIFTQNRYSYMANGEYTDVLALSHDVNLDTSMITHNLDLSTGY